MTTTMQNVPMLDYEPTDITGKSILVTGGTTGIGRATALLLAANGARVMIFGRHREELDDAMNDLREISDEVHGTTADTSKPEDIRRVFEEIDERFGGIDILVNNAALGAGGVADGGYDEHRYIVEVNLLGYIACADEAVARMKKKGEGHIVNIGSMSADVREKGSSVYVATKAGIQGFTAALRKELNEQGIKVSLIEPGSVDTDMSAEESTPEEQRKQLKEMKMMKAEDIAACVYYCITQPKRCDVVSVQIRPHRQEI